MYMQAGMGMYIEGIIIAELFSSDPMVNGLHRTVPVTRSRSTGKVSRDSRGRSDTIIIIRTEAGLQQPGHLPDEPVEEEEGDKIEHSLKIQKRSLERTNTTLDIWSANQLANNQL